MAASKRDQIRHDAKVKYFMENEERELIWKEIVKEDAIRTRDKAVYSGRLHGTVSNDVKTSTELALIAK